ncbi:histidine utilization repressor [Inquilinus limosus]|uniref:histidine utilization repressor n=1 Tax=Inquilinus limosus TaxID=171674 RepID=UPI0003FE4FA0|nr:histidine utilization repressor [Inquilinus limosus]
MDPQPLTLTLGEPLPLYRRVKAMILRFVETGEWPANGRVPSENELVRSLGISRMTIHRALRELTEAGVLVRVQGVGTFVAGAKPEAPLMEIRSIADDVRARGHAHSAAVMLLRAEALTGEAAARLEVPEGAAVAHSVLIHHEDDVPILLEDRFVRLETAPHYLAQDFTRITPHDYLMQQAPLSEGEHVVEAVLAEPWEREHLRIGRHEPCLLVHRRTWSAGRLVSVARLLFPGSRYRIGGRFTSRPGLAVP